MLYLSDHEAVRSTILFLLELKLILKSLFVDVFLFLIVSKIISLKSLRDSDSNCVDNGAGSFFISFHSLDMADSFNHLTLRPLSKTKISDFN
jgi:hypothetical protein